ncbi:MAG: DUF5522 domain-containing protein [Bacteroidota bacterium]
MTFSVVKKKETKPKGKEEPLFYEENGFLVFTKQYHLQRGYCCQNGCRHCPYGFKKKA